VAPVPECWRISHRIPGSPLVHRETDQTGDYLLCYLTGISRWIGLLEARSEGYLDEAPLWTEALFPARVKVKLIVELASETAVPVFDLRDQLSIFRNLQNPNAWTGHFRGSPTRWKPSDGEAVAAALLAAKSSPVKGCRSEEATQDASRPTEQDGSGHGTCL
jgi:hypothetical protein